MAILGILSILGFAWLISTNRRWISWRLVFVGIALQFTLGVLVLGIPAIGLPALLRFFFDALNESIVRFLSFTDAGSEFLFGPLIHPERAGGFIFAFKVLPSIIFFSALVSIFYHLGLLQKVINAFAYVLRKTLNVGGAESLSTSAQIFLGQTEAPLLIRPYVARLTQSELFVVMVGGMATVAGGVLAAYVALLKDRVPDIAGHLLTASLMSAPAAFVIAKMMIPAPVKEKKDKEEAEAVIELPKDANVVDAAARGASDGLSLALNVAAMLLAFIALIALLNSVLGLFGDVIGLPGLSFEIILAYLCMPIALLMDIPYAEAFQVGKLIGQKVVLNEFVAYAELSKIQDVLDPRTILIVSYALCGFANFSSIGIQIGGIGGLAPARRSEIARLGLKAVLAGNLAAFMTACVAALLI